MEGNLGRDGDRDRDRDSLVKDKENNWHKNILVEDMQNWVGDLDFLLLHYHVEEDMMAVDKLPEDNLHVNKYI